MKLRKILMILLTGIAAICIGVAMTKGLTENALVVLTLYVMSLITTDFKCKNLKEKKQQKYINVPCNKNLFKM